MQPEEKARLVIDRKLKESGWIIQDLSELNLIAGLGVAVREYQTSCGKVDYALFMEGVPVGVVEAKAENKGEILTTVEAQNARYAHSELKYFVGSHSIRFAYEATSQITRFTDYKDIDYRSRAVFSFHRPETLLELLGKEDTIRNNMKRIRPLDGAGFRECQIKAIQNLDKSFADNRPKALVQMATGAGKTYTAITFAYRLLKYSRVNRILFLADTKSLGIQAEQEFRAYIPNDDARVFPDIYGVHRLVRSYMPGDCQIYISTIQRMYSILKGEELDEKADEISFNEVDGADRQKPKEVVYNPKYPPEFFDCIIVDECHRSIYNVWKQVLDYFDAFIVGLTATPDQRTFAFFNQNVVSEYSREQAIVDGVNVGEDIFVIETDVSKHGGHLMKQMVEYRDRLTRARRWKQLDEEVDYSPSELDRNVVNLSQIITIIRTFKENVFTTLFPRRKEVPKTLIFAKTDSHADDIINVVREEFGKGNEFCQKITYSAKNAEQALSSFRNEYNPTIAVTVNMIATGTDVKAIECLVFMRDVRSRSYFEQMKGRGTRTLNKDQLQQVTPSATENKDHFVIIDATGVTRSKKTDSRPLDVKPSVSTKTLMTLVATGTKDKETLTALASRIARLNSQMTATEKQEFKNVVGQSAGEVAQNLLNAFDDDVVCERAEIDPPDEKGEIREEDKPKYERTQKELVQKAIAPFHKPQVRNFIESTRNSHEQIIDSDNVDTLLFAGFAESQQEKADQTIKTFREFIEERKDEIIALGIIYDQPYQQRAIALDGLKKLYEKLKQRAISVETLWTSYAVKKPDNVKKGTVAQLADLVSMIRFEMGMLGELTPFAERVHANFQSWTMKKNSGNVHFTDEQMAWLRLVRDHIKISLSITYDDLELTPFDARGGLAKFYEIFGDEYESILAELNSVLVS